MADGVLVTGGLGFIGSALVRSLVAQGKRVRVFDNHFRGSPLRIADLVDRVELRAGDIRDAEAVSSAVAGMDTIYHLAWINGTQHFYERPSLVLEVGVRGQLNIAAALRESAVRRFVFVSSSEVYQSAPAVPTPEDVACTVPDVHNPRYSYGCGKLIGEMIALHGLGDAPTERVIVRPHNVYGPDMGFEHVIPQLLERIYAASDGLEEKHATIQLQGSGHETRAFCYIDDAVRGLLLAGEQGGDGEIYNVGTQDEVSVRELAASIAGQLGIELEVEPGRAALGGTPRRCPSIAKLGALGYRPRVSLAAGLEPTIAWYLEHFSGRGPA